MQARWQRGKVPRDTKFFSLTPNYTVYKIISKTSDKISLQQDDSAPTGVTPYKMGLGIPKCKTLNISSKKFLSNREHHIDGTLLTTASKTIDLGIKPLHTTFSHLNS